MREMILVVILTLFATKVDCQRRRDEERSISNCPWKCKCSPDVSNKELGRGVLVNCTGRDLKRFPYPLPTATTTLLLDRNRISEITEDNFKGVHYLRTLNMESNRLTQLGILSFGRLPLLTTINFRRNRIKELQFQFLRNTPNVKVLFLAENKISRLEYGIFDVVDKLQFLDLGKNNISVIQDGAFLGLKRLETLFLNDNKLTKISSSLFPDVFNLKTLHLDHNRIDGIQSSSFERQRFLEVLSLSDNLLSHIRYSTISGLKNLQGLYLQRNRISKIDPWAFTQLKNLETLYLYSNVLDSINENIFVGLRKLKFLHLGMNNIQYIINDAFIDLRLLVTLSLDSNKITTLSPRTFSGLRQVRDVQLYFNNITFVAKNTFAEFIRLNRLVWDIPDFFRNQKQYLNVVGNNLHCDCNALWLRDWLRRSKKASITCQSPPALKGTSLVLIKDSDTQCDKIVVKVTPKKVTTLVGGDVQLYCNVKPGATYTWTLNGTAVELDTYHTVNPLGTLRIKSVSQKDVGRYICIATNAAGMSADNAEIRIGIRPTFTTLPSGVDLEDPLKPVMFRCSATGIPPPKIAWFKDNLEIRASSEEDSEFQITSEGALIFIGKRHHITREGNLIILSPRAEDEGPYTCVAENSLGKTSYRTNLYVDMSSKCLYGCNAGGVCQPSQYTCVCTQGFHSESNQCVKDKVPTRPPTKGSVTGSGSGSGSGVGAGGSGSGPDISGEGSGGISGDGSGATPRPSMNTNKPPIDQEHSGDEIPTHSTTHTYRRTDKPTHKTRRTQAPTQIIDIDGETSGSGGIVDNGSGSGGGSHSGSGSGSGETEDGVVIQGLRSGKPTTGRPSRAEDIYPLPIPPTK